MTFGHGICIHRFVRNLLKMMMYLSLLGVLEGLQSLLMNIITDIITQRQYGFSPLYTKRLPSAQVETSNKQVPILKSWD